MICPKCKRFHYVPGECPAPRSATPAARAPGRAVPKTGNTKPAATVTPQGNRKAAGRGASRPKPSRPVPSIQEVRKVTADLERAFPSANVATGDELEPTPKPEKKKRGRPATGFDKKAYDREKARERRAAKKKVTP